jgi:hypothetical protein
MKEWIEKLDDFLRAARRNILSHSGKISNQEALEKTRKEYQKHRKRELYNILSQVEKHFLEIYQGNC